jgi:hypothetical protein
MMRIGISGEVVQTKMVRLTLSVDGINPNDNAQSVNIGGELGLLNELLQLRVGYKDLFLPESEFGLSYGLGIHEISLFGNLTVSTDYGYQKFVHLGYSNRFTVIIKF